REGRRHPLVELARQDVLAQGADGQRGERDAELHRRDEAARVGRDAEDVARSPVALVLELDDPRPARRHEAVLRGHEEGIEQDQGRNPDQLEEECHALTSRARVLGGFSSNSPAGVYGCPRPPPPGRTYVRYAPCGCAPSTARSLAAARSTACAACRSRG